METIAIETRRHIKPGDIFKAHLATTARDVSDIDQALIGGVQMQKASGSTTTVDASGGMLHGHESIYAGDMRGVPYHWGLSIPRFSLRDINYPEENMKNLQSGVMDAIHDALSKETLIKKLVIPFNDTNFACKNAVSQWEWQKNTALLDLEHQNQQLQQRLYDAANEVMKAHAQAEYDRKILAEALQKGKKELYLIGRAEIMRTRLIERTRLIARSQLLYSSFFSWWRYFEFSKKKRTLKKAEIFWQKQTLAQKFDRLIIGCKKIREKRQLNLQAKCHWLEKCFKHWWWRTKLKEELKKKVMKQVKLHTLSVLRNSFLTWQEHSSQSICMKIQVKRAMKVNSCKYLQRSWNQWKRHVEILTDGLVVAGNFLFKRLVGDCVSGWLNVVYRKKQLKKQTEMSTHLAGSKIQMIAFDIWYKKVRMVHVVKERLTHFTLRKKEKMLKSPFTKWRHQTLWSRFMRTIQRFLTMKVKVWYLRWGFSQMKQRWVLLKLLEISGTQRVITTRSGVLQQWSGIVMKWKAGRKLLTQIQKNHARRWLQRFFYLWKVFTANIRRSSIEDEAHKLEVKVKLLEINLKGAAHVQCEMDKLVVELESGRTTLKNSVDAAMARNPMWTSSFLDVLLRWTVPSVAWLPPARAGHTAVSLPRRIGSEIYTRVIIFGGYNGQEYWNNIFIFETDDMQWKTPTCSISNDCGIPSPRQTHTTCAVGDSKMILLGGFDGTNDLSDLFILKVSEDGLSCEWSKPPSVVGLKPGPISQHTSCIYKDGHSMVVFGGYRSSMGFLNELWFWDLNWMLWSAPDYFGTPPSPRRGHGAAIIGTKMFVFGGFNGRESLADLHALDLESMTWEAVETQGEIPCPRRQFSVAVVGQHFVLHGGYNGQNFLGDVFSFHASYKRWNKWPEKETQQSLLEIGQGGEAYGRSMHTMVECGQRLVIFGGVHEWGALQDILFIENASAIEGLYLQRSLVEELEKTKHMQLKVIECEDTLRRKNIELVKAQEDIKDLQNTLQVESEKRKNVVQGHHILSSKLHNTRKILDQLSQKYHGLQKENERIRIHWKEYINTNQQTS